MNENHQDLNSLRIWLIKIYPVGDHSSWRKWTHEKLGEWWIAKDDWAIRVWWKMKSLKESLLSESLHFWKGQKMCEFNSCSAYSKSSRNYQGMIFVCQVGFPGGSDSKKIHLQCRRPGFNPWVWKIPWRRAWQSTLVFLPEESHGQQSLAGYNSWGHEESDTTEVTEYALISKENLHGDFQSGILPNICIL